jgi:Secretion system C-terminal sorting domain/Domain of unknown function (DUF5122) beta-propeller
MIAQNWSNVGHGLNSSLRCMMADDAENRLYMGGDFAKAYGDTVLSGICYYQNGHYYNMGCGVGWGCNWNPANGLTSAVRTIVKYNGNIVIGGNFSKLDDKPVKYLGMWNGTDWDSIGKCPNGSIAALYVTSDNKLIVGGHFDSIGGISCYNIAIWDGINWSTFSNPMPIPLGNLHINCIIEYNNELYVGGNFENGSGGLNELAKWDGNNWVNPGISFTGGFAAVDKMLIYQNELYVIGGFNISNGNLSNNIVRYDGQNWKDVGGGTDEFSVIYDICIHNGKLYAVGPFNYAGGINAKYIAYWDGNQWCGLGTNFDGVNFRIASLNNELFIGSWITIDSDTVNYVARWTGGNYVDTCGSLTTINEPTTTTQPIQIHPNPTTAQFTITTNQLIQNIKIYNTIGQCVQHSPLLRREPVPQMREAEAEASIDISHLQSGIYLIEVQTEKGVLRKKVIKE